MEQRIYLSVCIIEISFDMFLIEKDECRQFSLSLFDRLALPSQQTVERLSITAIKHNIYSTVDCQVQYPTTTTIATCETVITTATTTSTTTMLAMTTMSQAKCQTKGDDGDGNGTRMRQQSYRAGWQMLQPYSAACNSTEVPVG